MKCLIIYKSIHHGNTKKIAEVLAKELKAQLLEVEKFEINDFEKFDLIGFGSGIYLWRHHSKLLKLVDKLPYMKKNVFIFSTSGAHFRDFKKNHKILRKKLLTKGYKIIGEFNCLGWDTFGPLKILGGINKGHPNLADFKKAQKFAKRIKRIIK